MSTVSPAELARLLDAVDHSDGVLGPDYNVAPTANVPAIVHRKGERSVVALRWGLVPSWAKDPRIGSKLINARVETVAEKPAFRSAFERRRCLLPADGYYEWAPAAAPKGPKQPYFLTPADGSLIVMAGLYEFWRDVEGHFWRTTTIITTDAPDEWGHIHDRVPMTVPADRWTQWLDPETRVSVDVLRPAMASPMIATAVSTQVNDVRNNGPDLIVPVDDDGVVAR